MKLVIIFASVRIFCRTKSPYPNLSCTQNKSGEFDRSRFVQELQPWCILYITALDYLLWIHNYPCIILSSRWRTGLVTLASCGLPPSNLVTKSRESSSLVKSVLTLGLSGVCSCGCVGWMTPEGQEKWEGVYLILALPFTGMCVLKIFPWAWGSGNRERSIGL